MKLEFKNIAPYLPYGLKAVLTVDKREEYAFDDWVDETNLEKFNKGCIWQYAGYADGDLSIPLGEGDLNGFILRNENTYTCFNGGVKPILRPLSDLIKMIDCPEVMGEKFIPNQYLKDNYIGEMMHTNIASWSHRVVEKLFEWHFDIFSLIDNGLALDYNQINI